MANEPRQNDQGQPQEGKERRTGARAETNRPAVFSPLPEGALCQGTVLDISPNGMRIRTAAPATPGTDLEIEVLPRAGEETPPLFTRGTVVWVDKKRGGVSSMGVRFLARRGAIPPMTGLRPARIRPQYLRPKNDDIEAGQPVIFRAAPRPAKSNTGKRLAIFLILLCILIALLWPLKDELKRQTAAHDPAENVPEAALNVAENAPNPPTEPVSEPEPVVPHPALPPPALPLPAPPVDEPIQSAPEPGPPAPSVAALLDKGQAALLDGAPNSAREAFLQLQDNAEASPLEHFLARMGDAEALLALGERGKALTTLGVALANDQGVPAPWLDAAREFREHVLQVKPDAPYAPFLLEFLGLEPSAPLLPSLDPDTGTPLENNLAPAAEENGGAPRLEVDTEQYLLHVRQGDRTLASFPVGLGRNAATPRGVFQIVNKIENPDWYHNGRVIRAGDPENPLGERWMGLGDPQGRTPYGIHPTGEPDSIGRNQSRGCIRMRPEDALKLFHMVDVGTRVQIAP